MTQSRKGSFAEALINVFIGYWINFAANMLIFPMFGYNITFSDNLVIGAVFTVISIARSYAIRRWCNGLIVRAAQKMS